MEALLYLELFCVAINLHITNISWLSFNHAFELKPQMSFQIRKARQSFYPLNSTFSYLIENGSCSSEIDTRGEYIFIVWCSNIYIRDSARYIPPNVTSLLFRRSKDKNLNKTVFQNNGRNIVSLKIDGGKLNTITSDFFFGLPLLKRLSLKNNYIYSLPKDVLKHNPNVEELDVSGNVFRSLKTIFHVTSYLPNIQKLQLNKNKVLEEIREDDFSEVPNSSVEELDLSDCSIRMITSQSFTPLINLKVLDISVNPLNNIAVENITICLKNSKFEYLRAENLFRMIKFPTKALSHLRYTNISVISLGYGRFLTIGENSLPYLPTLTKLELRNCVIRRIHRNAFSNLPNLKELILNQNELTNLDGLNKLTGLIRLEMLNNRLPGYGFSLGKNQLSTLSNLQKLNLEKCTINSALKTGVFDGLFSLKNLNLDEMRILSIEDHVFRDLTNLTILHLSTNMLGTLGLNTFYGLPNLDQLYLAENKLILENNNSFNHLRNIEYIVMSNNQIRTLPKGLFINLDKLAIINLSKNKITNWTYEVFPTKKSLRSISLQYNMIRSISPRMLAEFSGLADRGLFLENNPLDCRECGMLEFQQWVINTSVVDRKRNIMCSVSNATMEKLVLANITNLHCLPEVNIIHIKLTIGSLVALTLILVIIFAVYKLRWYMRYWIFLIKIKTDKSQESRSKVLYEYDAFVSYSHEDSNWVIETFLAYLEKFDVKLCLHQRDFEVGIPITDNILRAIEFSRRTVIILSQNFINSDWCILEAHMAEQALREARRDGIVIVSFDDMNKKNIPKNLRYIMKTRTHLTWPYDKQGQKTFWKLMRSVFGIQIPNENDVAVDNVQ